MWWCYTQAMPEPKFENAIIPEGFDPEKHCGAAGRKSHKACMMMSGERTDHPGLGRCWLHGGATPVVHGRSSKVVRQTIFERVNAMESDPRLLSLDKQLAALHVLFDMQLRKLSLEGEGFETVLDIIESAVASGDVRNLEIPDEIVPRLDMETIDMMVKLSKTIYEMRFSKRFSMPITQVQQILMSLMDSFAAISMKYGIPAEARAEFAKAIRSLRAVGAVDDPQLIYAGGGAAMIDGTARTLE